MERTDRKEDSGTHRSSFLEGRKSSLDLEGEDGSSNGNPPERCPRPLYSWDSTQEGHTIPHHHQSGNLWDYNIVVKEDYNEEDEEYGVMEEFSDGYNDIMESSNTRNPPERCPSPLYSSQEDQYYETKFLKQKKMGRKHKDENDIRENSSCRLLLPQYCKGEDDLLCDPPGEHNLNPDMFRGLSCVDRSPDPSNPVESSPNRSHALTLNTHRGICSVETLPDPSEPKESSPLQLNSSTLNILPELQNGHPIRRTSEWHCVQSPDCKVEYEDISEDPPEENPIASNINLGPHSGERSPNPPHPVESSLDKSNIVTPNIHSELPSASADPVDLSPSHGVPSDIYRTMGLGSVPNLSYLTEPSPFTSHTVNHKIEPGLHSLNKLPDPNDPDNSHSSVSKRHLHRPDLLPDPFHFMDSSLKSVLVTSNVNPGESTSERSPKSPKMAEPTLNRQCGPSQKLPHRERRIYQCPECGKCFKQSGNLIVHRRIHTGEKPFQCLHCGKAFAHQSNLVQHQIVHRGQAPPPSAMYGNGLSSPLEVRRHQRTCDVFSCSYCGKCFKHMSNLVTHERVHLGEKPFSCSECGKSFKQKSALISHCIIHTGEKPFLCSECGKSFKQRSALSMHLKIHTGERPYACSECGKSFRDNSALVRHYRMHTGEKPYPCPDCGKRFAHVANLIPHQRIHTGERPYACSDCGKGFSSKSYLAEHQTIHTDSKPFPCPECGKSFKRKTILLQHQKTHEMDTPFICPECGKGFKRKATLDQHLNVHAGVRSYLCFQCGRSFSQKPHLALHERLHHSQ
ncbi:hypothetical protein AB205_0026310 [Aquarana catesbeiana]|uniref:C2H2-type domain-containing protein n=1 Tax=Aquarana catesbeiana TaxID=8400 RepID=A0A2G9QLK3_AQUCT|nr:hypothetical protein AB205_0026310 [Aquarana catesbeiana]